MKPTPLLTPENKEWIKANSANYTAKEMGDKFGVSQQCIFSFIDYHQLPMKRLQVRRKPVIIESEFFNIDNYKNLIV